MSSIVLESDLLQFLLIIIQDAIGENYEPNPAMRGSYEQINEHSIVQAIKRTFQGFFASVPSPQRSSNGSRVGVAMSPKAQLALLFLDANLHRKTCGSGDSGIRRFVAVGLKISLQNADRSVAQSIPEGSQTTKITRTSPNIQ